MQLADILSPARVVAHVDAGSKKRALEKLSEIIADHSSLEVSAGDIFDSLLARERLGTTAIDHGVAIPHGRLKDGEQTVGAFIQLNQGVDCDAMDQQKVRLLFALLVPAESTEEHLQLLARLARMFSDKVLREQLEQAADDRELYERLMAWDRSH